MRKKIQARILPHESINLVIPYHVDNSVIGICYICCSLINEGLGGPDCISQKTISIAVVLINRCNQSDVEKGRALEIQRSLTEQLLRLYTVDTPLACHMAYMPTGLRMRF